MEDEELLISKPEVYLYDIPPGQDKSDGDHRAAVWNGEHPTWKGKILIYMAGPCCHVQLDDHQGNIYAQAVIDEYPGNTLKLASDSRRYFTLNIQNKEGHFKLVGIGFTAREDSTEINNILKGYFAAAVSRKRKVEKGIFTLNWALPLKKEKSTLVELIYSKTNDREYEYITENKFKCHVCPFSFNCPKLMVQHWKKIHNQINAQLCLCKLPFPFRGERLTHCDEFHGNALQCEICKSRFHTEEDLEYHLLKKHRQKPKGQSINDVELAEFKCSYCNQDCFTKSQLIKHFKDTHTAQNKQSKTAEVGGEELSITRSNNSESAEASFIHRDLEKYSNYAYFCGNLFQCQQCTTSFKNIRKLTRHWRSAHANKIKYCDCEFPFPSRTQLKIHVEKFHNFFCFACSAKYCVESLLEEHLLAAHLCDYTGKKINSLDTIKFQCGHCKDWFSFKGQLVSHLKLKHLSSTDSGTVRLKTSDVESIFTLHSGGKYPHRVCNICGEIIFTIKKCKQHYHLHFTPELKPGSDSTEVADGGKVVIKRDATEITSEGDCADQAAIGNPA